MNLLILGRGKTGSLVAEVARERKHHVSVLASAENRDGKALEKSRLTDVDVVIDFTTPQAVLENIRACARAGKNVVVGTTGWYQDLPAVRELVQQSGIGLVYAANFSVGVNLFFEVARASASALRHHYHGQIFERHHVHKKDAPSGTAVAIQNIIRDASGDDLEIISFREGEVVGMHEVVYECPNDTIYLCHDANSRRGFAEGAVRAAEWLKGKRGFFDFRDIWKELK
ncbi:MAG TPA: 4-hydroxy-tetrahydrodipicolinate reductase [Terriglobales bacterium]|nr:4-hydroxy-tetrahydrodipicolinate reductase [Terriglobales bacterium]